MMPHWYSCNTYKLFRKKDFASTSENNPPSLIQLFPFWKKYFIPTAVAKLEDVSPPLEKGRVRGWGGGVEVCQFNKVCSSVSKSLSCKGGMHLELRSDQKIGYSRFMYDKDCLLSYMYDKDWFKMNISQKNFSWILLLLVIYRNGFDLLNMS